MRSVAEFSRLLGKEFFAYQVDAFSLMRELPSPQQRLCLFYKTGAGKSITALVSIAQLGFDDILVLAPPSARDQWEKLAAQIGVEVTVISHAKFRQPGYKVSKTRPIVVDEFHLLGGHKGQGWKKMARTAAGVQAPVVICSATPNYNDAERVYCVQHILDRHSVKGGYLQFLYDNCITQQNPFGMEPLVTGFQRYPDAAAYLVALPNVVYVPDDVEFTLVDIPMHTDIPEEFELYNLNRRTNRIMASQMEARFQKMYYQLVDDDGWIREHVWNMLIELVGQAHTPVMFYCDSSQVAERLAVTCVERGNYTALITGKTPVKQKQAILDDFRAGKIEVLVGTASLATGTDGLDKACDTLIIVCDTQDPSLRRQLLGRILPRGEDTDVSRKQFFRLVF